MTDKDDAELRKFWHEFSTYSQKEFAKENDTQQLKPGDWEFHDNTLRTVSGLKPLQPNQRLILETIYQLKPKSVFEFGFGSGDNLHNIKAMNPDMDIFGIDVCEDNLIWAHKRNPELRGKLMLWDATWPFSKDIEKVDLCFSNTVLMHINDTPGYLCALANMFLYSRNYVILMENWETHAYMHDILALHSGGMIPWKKVNFYYRHCPEYDRPHLMIITNDRSLPYLPLTDYYKTLWTPLVTSPDANAGKLPGQSAVRPVCAFG